jgi:uncharacterized protein (DUF4415 family)
MKTRRNSPGKRSADIPDTRRGKNADRRTTARQAEVKRGRSAMSSTGGTETIVVLVDKDVLDWYVAQGPGGVDA